MVLREAVEVACFAVHPHNCPRIQMKSTQYESLNFFSFSAVKALKKIKNNSSTFVVSACRPLAHMALD